MRFGLSLPDYDVFSGSVLKLGSRTDPFIHDVNLRSRSRPGILLFPLDREPGGARRDRTDDLMLAKHALYQLSYGPSFAPARPELRRAGPPLSEAFFPCGVAGVGRASSSEAPRARRTMVGPGRLELPTSR